MHKTTEKSGKLNRSNEYEKGLFLSKDLQPVESQFLMYTSPKGKVKIEVIFQDETVWLSLNKIADLFGTSKQNISYHIQNVYQENELSREATVKEILTVQDEGGRAVKRSLEYYNLDAIIAVGYRVNSYEATQFRIWATQTLKEFIIKGFVMDDERLKNGTHFGKDRLSKLLKDHTHDWLDYLLKSNPKIPEEELYTYINLIDDKKTKGKYATKLCKRRNLFERSAHKKRDYPDILSLVYDHEVKDYFLKNGSIDYKMLGEFKSIPHANYTILNNKDGEFAWRRMQLIHPLLYVGLVDVIANNWSAIKNYFNQKYHRIT